MRRCRQELVEQDIHASRQRTIAVWGSRVLTPLTQTPLDPDRPSCRHGSSRGVPLGRVCLSGQVDGLRVVRCARDKARCGLESCPSWRIRASTGDSEFPWDIIAALTLRGNSLHSEFLISGVPARAIGSVLPLTQPSTA